MIEHYNKDRKPFKIGQLVYDRFSGELEGKSGLLIVLDIQWGSYYHHSEFCWVAHVLHQQTGKKDWEPSASFRAAEEKDD